MGLVKREKSERAPAAYAGFGIALGVGIGRPRIVQYARGCDEVVGSCRRKSGRTAREFCEGCWEGETGARFAFFIPSVLLSF